MGKRITKAMKTEKRYLSQIAQGKLNVPDLKASFGQLKKHVYPVETEAYQPELKPDAYRKP